MHLGIAWCWSVKNCPFGAGNSFCGVTGFSLGHVTTRKEIPGKVFIDTDISIAIHDGLFTVFLLCILVIWKLFSQLLRLTYFQFPHQKWTKEPGTISMGLPSSSRFRLSSFS